MYLIGKFECEFEIGARLHLLTRGTVLGVIVSVPGVMYLIGKFEFEFEIGVRLHLLICVSE